MNNILYANYHLLCDLIACLCDYYYYHYNGLFIDQMGSLEVTNHKTKHKAILTFKTTDMLHKDLHKVEGYVYDAR